MAAVVPRRVVPTTTRWVDTSSARPTIVARSSISPTPSAASWRASAISLARPRCWAIRPLVPTAPPSTNRARWAPPKASPESIRTPADSTMTMHATTTRWWACSSRRTVCRATKTA